MARDYAKYRLQPLKKKKADNGWRKKLGYSILIVCLGSAVILGIYAYKSTLPESPRQKLAAWIAQVKLRLDHKKAKSSPGVTKSPLVSQAKQDPEIHFNFYTELPNMQVTLPETEQVVSNQALVTKQNALLAATKPERVPPAQGFKKNKKDAENTGQYILQLGAFKNEATAGQMRISLLLAGFEADVVKSLAGKQIIYHIQKGPYATLARVREVQKQLQSKGVRGIVKTIEVEDPYPRTGMDKNT